jgi:fido (protein-threonine AMPylation protein)
MLEVLPFPRTPTEFRMVCLVLHGHIFGKAEPAIAARFRVRGEVGIFGGEGGHMLAGAQPEDIPSSVEKAWHLLGSCDLATVNRSDLVKRMARFLESFFFTHPFVDGNGRVARLVLLHVVSRTGRWAIRFPTDRKEHRRYLFALQAAHRDTQANGSPDCRSYIRDPVWLLVRWLDRCLDDVPAILEEIPP